MSSPSGKRDDMTSPTNAARPLIVRFGALGDMVLLGIQIRILSQLYDSLVDVVSLGPWVSVVTSGQPGVGEVKTIHSRKRPYWCTPSQWSLVQWLRRRPPGPVWFLDPTSAGRELMRRAGIPDAHVVELSQVPAMGGEHMVVRANRAIQRYPQAYPPKHPWHTQSLPPMGAQLQLQTRWVSDFQSWLARQPFANQPCLLVQMGNGVTTRRGRWDRRTNLKFWPLSHWARVIQIWSGMHPHHAILLLGTPRESALNQAVLALSDRPQVHDVSPDLPLERLIMLCRHADGLLGVDTGPAHIAAAVGLPQVTLFGPASAQEYRPLAANHAPVITVETPTPPRLEFISIDSVVSALLSLTLKSSQTPFNATAETRHAEIDD